MQHIDFTRQEGPQRALKALREHFGGASRRYFIQTFGCQMNVHDSEAMAGMLDEAGMIPCDLPAQADVILVNTCCVREHAEAKVAGALGRYCKLKEERPGLVIGLCGCMMQQEDAAQALRRRFPKVDFFLGTHHPERLPQTLLSVLQGQRRLSVVTQDEGVIIERMPHRRDRKVTAWVSIMYGCDNFCTYCIVPHVRGRERSRLPEDVLEEVRALAAEGCREVTLLGQNVNSYGKGLPQPVTFAQLLRQVAREPGIARVRFMTSHPKDLSDELIAVMAEEPAVCKQLHLPVQSGSDGVLQAMNRKYSRGDYLSLVGRLRTAIAGLCLSTDVIVGFPGETEGDFADTLSLMEAIRFDSAFMFKYSPRRGTAAAKLPLNLSEEEMDDRLQQLIALQEEITLTENGRWVGTVQQVLAESVSTRSPGDLCGRTDGGRMVNFPGVAEQIGRIIPVSILSARAHTLYGEAIHPEA